MSRMDTAIVLLIIVALAAACGTALTQNMASQSYENVLGPFWFSVLNALGFTNVYKSPWFLAILALLFVSVGACLWRNGPVLLRQMLSPKKVGLKWLKAQAKEVDFSEKYIANKKFPKKLTYQADDVEITLYQKGLRHRIGYFLTHIAVLVLVVGGAVTALGWRGVVLLPAGEKTTQALQVKGDALIRHTLPFSLAMQNFEITYHPNGQPKQFTSTVQVETGEGMQKRVVTVNKPMRVEGYNFFQASYGDAGSKATLQMRELESGNITPPAQQQVYVPFSVMDGSYEISLTAVHENIPEPVLMQQGQVNPATVNFGPAVDYVLTPPTSAPLQLRAYVNHPNLFAIGDGEGNYSPVYLGLDLTNNAAWQVFKRLQAAKPADAAAATEWLKTEAEDFLQRCPKGKNLALRWLCCRRIICSPRLRCRHCWCQQRCSRAIMLSLW